MYAGCAHNWSSVHPDGSIRHPDHSHVSCAKYCDSADSFRTIVRRTILNIGSFLSVIDKTVRFPMQQRPFPRQVYNINFIAHCRQNTTRNRNLEFQWCSGCIEQCCGRLNPSRHLSVFLMFSIIAFAIQFFQPIYNVHPFSWKPIISSHALLLTLSAGKRTACFGPFRQQKIFSFLSHWRREIILFWSE